MFLGGHSVLGDTM